MQQVGVLNDGKKLGYAFGLGIGPYRGLNTIGHSGGDAAYSSFVFWFPEQRFGVVTLSNFGSVNPQRLAMRIADIYLADKLAPAPATSTPVERAKVKVDPAIFEAYVGRYLAEGLGIITISREGDRLMGQPGRESKAELIPQSEMTFFVKENNAEITFERDEKNKVVRLAMKTGSQTRSARRLDSPPATAEQLAQFAGDYYSPEFGTIYTMVVKDGQLTAQHRRHNDIQMTELEGDLFAGGMWFFQSVRFTRDSQKRIDGFRLTSGRVRNVRFEKMSKIIN